MKRKSDGELIPLARDLRRNMTAEERHLWYDFLRDYPIRFRRQKIIGRYIADFYCAEAEIVIELDGSQHYSEYITIKDAVRTEFLREFGIEVIRIPNNVLKSNFAGVCEYIDLCVRERAGVKHLV